MGQSKATKKARGHGGWTCSLKFKTIFKAKVLKTSRCSFVPLLFSKPTIEIEFKDIGPVAIFVGCRAHPGRGTAARRLFPFIRPSDRKQPLGYLAGAMGRAQTTAAGL